MTVNSPTSPSSPSKPLRKTSRSNSSGYNAPDFHNLAAPPAASSSTDITSPKRQTSSPSSSKSDKSSDHPGSARTKLRTLKSPSLPPVPLLRPPLSRIDDENTKTEESSPVLAPLPSSSEINEVDMDAPHAPYRPPEAVIEPPEEQPPGYVPGVISEHPPSDDDMPLLNVSPSRQSTTRPTSNSITGWQPYDTMDIDRPNTPDRPQIGSGILPRRLLEAVHEHELWQPIISELPQRTERKPSSHIPSGSISSINDQSSATPSIASTSQTSINTINPLSPTVPTSTFSPSVTLEDVWAACPGGVEGHQDWYFCTRCGGWLRISVTNEEPRELVNMDIWAIATVGAKLFPTEAEFEAAREARFREWSRYNDLKASKLFAPYRLDHLHEFSSLLLPKPEDRIGRIDVDDDVNAFPHLILGLDTPENWGPPKPPLRSTRMFASCSSDLWVVVEDGLVPGQIPMPLINDFCVEKGGNPPPGLTSNESISGAWELISTLLANPIFKSQRGWVKLENKKFQEKIGATLTSSCLLYSIGFGCRQEQDVLRVGPFSPGEKLDRSAVEQMDRYMLRTWVEVGIFLTAFQTRNHLTPSQTSHIAIKPLEEILQSSLNLHNYPKLVNPVPDRLAHSCKMLGVSKYDSADSIQMAYDAQIACDAEQTKIYLSALESISMTGIAGKESLQIKVVTERSVGRFTLDDVERSYNRIGYTSEHAEVLQVTPSEAPDDYIFDLHKKAVQAATSAAEKSDLAHALLIIGKDRQSETMMRLGDSGQTFMSVDDAYAALSAPRDSIDDGLIMQYEMAVAEYPGKTEHYKMCLNIIANAAGEDRPGVRAFLDTGSRQPDAPARKDIPVGLQNIGNTCYLNSILQYLYSIKPLREAVISFEQNEIELRTPLKPEVERSRRFVRQLRLLFLQLYQSDQPAVRPDEELAYLAITRPEVDQIVEPEISAPEPTPLLDSIPDMPSPSSTRVATPDFSPTLDNVSLPGSPRPTLERGGSILGKRASTDRDDSSRSSMDHSRYKSEGFEDLGDAALIDLNKEKASEDLEVILGDKKDQDLETAESPSAVTDLAGLKLKSPELEEESMVTVPPPLPPRPTVVRKDTLASGLRFGLQQDSAEVLINVLTQLETAFDPATVEEGVESTNLISDLFSCKFRQQTFYESSSGTVEAQTPVESVFVHPIIGVEEEGKDLYDCLAELYLKGADIEYEGKKGYMMDLMDRFPPMLYIQMRRSQYDFKTGRETKTNTHIAFDQVLAMDRFLVNADPKKREESIEITREMSRVRTRLHQLKNHQPLSIPLTYKHVREALGEITDVPDLDITSDFLNALEADGKELTEEINGLENLLPTLKKKLENVWEGERDFEYDLVSVFMHRGKTSGAGHYWTYQSHLPENPERFFKYNDETVTEVPATEVLHDRTGTDANPALLCYVRKGRDLVDTLHRQLLELEGEITQLTESTTLTEKGAAPDIGAAADTNANAKVVIGEEGQEVEQMKVVEEVDLLQ